MTQEERKNIRMRTEKESVAFPTRRSTVIHRDTIFSLLDDLDEVEARAEALERALKQLASCKSCINEQVHHFSEPCRSCKEPLYVNYQFDEPRFSGKEAHHAE